MKTIEEKANEYTESLSKGMYCLEDGYGDVHIECAFVAGAAFAQEWIPIERELPESGITVLIKDKNGYVGLSAIRYGEWDYKFKNMITHWRPITKK